MANKPNIRFKGFTDDWEQRKLGDCIIEFNEVTTINNQYPALTSSRKGIFLQTDYFSGKQIASDDNTGYNIVPYGYFTYRHMSDDEIFYFNINDIVENGIVSTLYPVFTTNNNLDSRYLQYQLNNGYEFAQFAILQKQGGSRTYMYLNKLKKMYLTVPTTIEEQKMISKYILELDHLITLHQRKCDETKKLKKFMLQKMFPKNGEKNPEIRFAGFTDDWEQRKLGEWGEFYYGRSCPKWSVTEDAITPCVRYGELYTKFGSKIDEIYSYTNMPVDNLRFSKGNEVLIPRVGEDPMDYNHCTWLSIPGVAIGEMISVFNTTQSPLFSAIMFNATLQREFAMRVEGGSVTNLYYDKLKNIDVLYPTMEEQKEIARYFSTLDHLITLHQRKCDKLKLIKKFMLQNMFPKKG